MEQVLIRAMVQCMHLAQDSQKLKKKVQKLWKSSTPGHCPTPRQAHNNHMSFYKQKRKAEEEDRDSKHEKDLAYLAGLKMEGGQVQSMRRNWILPQSRMSLDAASSPKPPVKKYNPAESLCETLSGELG